MKMTMRLLVMGVGAVAGAAFLSGPAQAHARCCKIGGLAGAVGGQISDAGKQAGGQISDAGKALLGQSSSGGGGAPQQVFDTATAVTAPAVEVAPAASNWTKKNITGPLQDWWYTSKLPSTQDATDWAWDKSKDWGYEKFRDQFDEHDSRPFCDSLNADQQEYERRQDEKTGKKGCKERKQGGFQIPWETDTGVNEHPGNDAGGGSVQADPETKGQDGNGGGYTNYAFWDDGRY